MNKPISTRTHGIIDYVVATTLIGLPYALGWRGRAFQLSVGSGLATLGMSMLTRYEFGVMPLLPMRMHLAIDAGESSMLVTAPRILRGDRADTGAGRILATIGAISAAIGSMTQTRSPQEMQRPSKGHG